MRWVGDGWAPAKISVRAGMARYVIPKYAHQDWILPAADDERKLLQDIFGATAVDPADSDTVLTLLKTRGSFDLLHFACHGVAKEEEIWNASLMMAGDLGRGGKFMPDPIDLSDVRSAKLAHPDGTRPVVFLNACQAGKTGRTLVGTGGMADAFISHGAGLFVGTLWSVGDRTALTFAKVFYERLKSGANVTQATRAAREAAKLADEPTWLAYTVYGHPYARLQ